MGAKDGFKSIPPIWFSQKELNPVVLNQSPNSHKLIIQTEVGEIEIRYCSGKILCWVLDWTKRSSRSCFTGKVELEHEDFLIAFGIKKPPNPNDLIVEYPGLYFLDREKFLSIPNKGSNCDSDFVDPNFRIYLSDDVLEAVKKLISKVG